jgi:hypothetical protein
MNCKCTLRGFTAEEGDYGDIHMIFFDPAVGILPDLTNYRFLLKNGNSKLFKHLPLDDREDARRFVEAVQIDT